MMRLYTYILSMVLMAVAGAVSAQSGESGAREVLDRTADAFRRAGGIQASFHVRSPEGYSEGTICLKGEKFVLRTEGMTTWFDGRTQWTYLSSSDEVNIVEPTPEELQGINPYAWLSLYDQGFLLKQNRNADAGVYEIEMVATSPEAQIERMVISIDKDSMRPVRVSLTLAGNTEATVINVYDYHTGRSWPDSFFTFDRKAYPTAEIIDLR